MQQCCRTTSWMGFRWRAPVSKPGSCAVSNSAGRSAIVGVGYSKILRDKGIDGRPLAVEASRAAIADAGLAVRDVDAVFEYAGDEQAMDIARLVGIENIVVYGDYTPRGPSGLAAALGAHMAVRLRPCFAERAALVIAQRACRHARRPWTTTPFSLRLRAAAAARLRLSGHGAAPSSSPLPIGRPTHRNDRSVPAVRFR